MTRSETDRLNERLDRLEAKLDDVRDWMHQQQGGRKAFYAVIGLSATLGGLVVKTIDWLKP